MRCSQCKPSQRPIGFWPHYEQKGLISSWWSTLDSVISVSLLRSSPIPSNDHPLENLHGIREKTWRVAWRHELSIRKYQWRTTHVGSGYSSLIFMYIKSNSLLCCTIVFTTMENSLSARAGSDSCLLSRAVRKLHIGLEQTPGFLSVEFVLGKVW